VNWTNTAGIVVVIGCIALMAGFFFRNRAHPYRGLRDIPAFTRLRRAVGLSVEDGSRLHISLGSASLQDPSSASAMVGLTVLERAARLSSVSDRPPVATSGDSTLAILSQDKMRAVAADANAPDAYDPRQGRLTGMTPFSYAAGAMPVFRDEQVSANIIIGNFGPEAALLADAAEQSGCFLLAASDAIPAQAVLYATAQEPLVGEELCASGAYLQSGSLHAASLHAQDVLRWVVVAGLVVGTILKFAGIL